MKNKIVAAFKKNKFGVAFKKQIVIAFVVGGAIIIVSAIFIITLIRLVYGRGVGAALARSVSEKLDAWRRGEAVIAHRRIDAVE